MLHRPFVPFGILLAIAFTGQTALAQGNGHGNGGITQMAGECGGPGNPCEPEPELTLLTGPVTRPVEAGPFSYTVRVKNVGDAAGAFILWCESSSPQVECSASPASIANLKVGFSATITVSYSTLGIGVFSHSIHAEAEPNADMLLVSPVQVTGASMLSHVFPADSASGTNYDLLQASANHPTGIVSGSMKVRVDNGAWVAYPAQAGGTAMDSVARHALAPGWHTWRSSACATNGRCDTLATQFTFSGPSGSWALDDSLPDAGPLDGATGGLLIGALPLPPNSLKGCPVGMDDPEIRLLGPGTYLSQPANQTTPAGILYRASVTAGANLRITTLTVDHTPSQGVTCDDWSFLGPAQYDYGFWQDAPDVEGFWSGYPYGDLSFGASDHTEPWERLELAALWGGVTARGPNPGAGATMVGAAASLRTRRLSLGGRLARALTARRAIPDPGAIDTASYQITVNNRVLLNGSYQHPKLTVVSLKRTGAKWDLEVHDSLLNRWSSSGGSPNGGWNEIVVSVADTFGNRTSVRSRWVQSLDGGSPQPIPLTALRDFDHRRAGDCPAFGALQCDEVLVAQPLPGFVTRDKDRGLSLVYRSGSQRAGTIVPVGMLIGRFLAKPDSLRTWATVGGVAVGSTFHFAGKTGGPSGANLLEDGAIEARAIGVLVPPPATGALALQRVRVNVASRYGAVSLTDTVSQDVVSLHLSDQAATRFGQGWAIGQLSRIHLDSAAAANPAIVWEQGDGSFLLFRKQAGTWQPATPAPVYLIDKVAGPEDGASWLVTLSSGARMGFASTGRQIWTADLLGNKTRFYWTGTAIDSIVDPAGPRYLFTYNALRVTGAAATGQVGDIRLRHGTSVRTIATLSYDATGTRLRKIVLRPDATTQDSTVLEYDTGLSAQGAYLTAVHDPRSTAAKPIVTRFVYDVVTGLPVHVELPADQFGVGQTKYRSPWRRAVPRATYGGPTTQERLVFQSQLIGTHVPVQGQTVDVTVDRFGGLTRVRRIAPSQAITFPFTEYLFDDVVDVERDSTTGLVRKVVRGRLDPASADSAMYWHDSLGRLDSTRMVSPRTDVTSATELLKFRYDVAVPSGTIAGGAAWCSRTLWAQGVAGGADTTSIIYGTTGAAKCLPATVRDPAGGITTYAYGSLTAGTPSATRPTGMTDPAGVSVTAGFETATWNTSMVTRPALSATEATHHGPFGRVDSVVSAEGHLTRFIHDSLGRTTHTIAGRGDTVPVTRSVFAPGGLVREVQVYAASSAEPQSPIGAVQVTRYFHDVHGALDSLVHPGSRVGKVARRQWWRRDRMGSPIWEYPGNGAYVARTYDFAGRLAYQNLSEVSPTAQSADGEYFADAGTVAIYNDPLQSGPLSPGKQLSAGQVFERDYDSFGRLTWEMGRDVALGDTLYTRTLRYSRKGAIVVDSLTYYEETGRAFAAKRTFAYNARGQRTRRTTTLVNLQGGGITEPTDTLLYAYHATTGRLTSLTGKVGGTTYAKVELDYDVAGREVERRTFLSGQGTPTLRRVWHYDAVGRRLADTTRSGSGSTVWSVFRDPDYSKVDELLEFTAREPGGGLYTHAHQYDDQRRLTYTQKAVSGGVSWTNSWEYDQFGNRVRQVRATTVGGSTCANAADSLGYGEDNRLLFEDPDDHTGCTRYSRFLVDHAGNRLARIDSGATGPIVQKSAYTALNQLYYTISPRDAGSYDLNRHWYDAGGLRILSQVHWQNTWSGDWTLSDGNRTFYLYDGADVAMTVVSTGPGAYTVQQRFLSGGVDEPMAGRFMTGAGLQNLAMVADHQGSTVAVVKPDGTQETTASYVSREPFGGALAGSGAAGSTNTETGYTGASTPNQRSGFTYLRNRWYDPQTGRFLTQDPLGLAGGTNLYAYAGNNPVAWSDPFGLCEPRCSMLERAWKALRSTVDGVYHKLGGEAGVRLGRGLESAADGAVDRAQSLVSLDNFSTAVDLQAGFMTTRQDLTTGVWGKPVASGGLELSIKLRASWAADPDATGVSTSHGGDVGEGVMVGATIDLVDGRPNGASVSAGLGVGVPIPGRLAKLLAGSSVEFEPRRSEDHR